MSSYCRHVVTRRLTADERRGNMRGRKPDDLVAATALYFAWTGGAIMRQGLAWVCVLGGLLAVGLTEGRSATGPALDKTTLAEVRKLQEKRRDALREALAVRETLFRRANGPLEGVVKTAKQLRAAELDLATTDGERIAAHQSYFEKARLWSEIVKARREAARATAADALEAQAISLEAEIGLLKAGGKPKQPKK